MSAYYEEHFPVPPSRFTNLVKNDVAVVRDLVRNQVLVHFFQPLFPVALIFLVIFACRTFHVHQPAGKTAAILDSEPISAYKN